MLTVEGVVPFLLQRGLIQERLVVDDNLQVVDVSRRNHNFKLISDAGPGFFLKQGAPGEAALTVAHEAQLYRWFSTHPSAERLTPLLPRCRLYDAEQCTLVLELVEEGQSMHEYHRRHRQLPGVVGSALGDALGTLHRLTQASRASDEPVPGRSGRFLQLHRPDMDAFTTASSGGLEVLRLVQQSGELCGLLDGLHQEWWERCVIHGDLRWDNCQLTSSASDVDGPRVQFVDWEMAGVGDPCWDAGTVFSECLSTWLRSTPVTRETPPEDFLPLAGFPLRRMQPAMRSFWRSYVRRMELDPDTATEWLGRAVRYAGARLVQTAYEEMQGAIRVRANVIYMLQLSLNVMERPLEAASVLLSVLPGRSVPV